MGRTACRSREGSRTSRPRRLRHGIVGGLLLAGLLGSGIAGCFSGDDLGPLFGADPDSGGGDGGFDPGAGGGLNLQDLSKSNTSPVRAARIQIAGSRPQHFVDG